MFMTGTLYIACTLLFYSCIQSAIRNLYLYFKPVCVCGLSLSGVITTLVLLRLSVIFIPPLFLLIDLHV